MHDDYLTIAEVSQLVQVDETTVRAWLERGLMHTEDGGVIKIRQADLEAFLAQQGQGQPRDAAEV
jgi:excisionase family DNA binding protein